MNNVYVFVCACVLPIRFRKKHLYYLDITLHGCITLDLCNASSA